MSKITQQVSGRAVTDINTSYLPGLRILRDSVMGEIKGAQHRPEGALEVPLEDEWKDGPSLSPSEALLRTKHQL